MAKRFTDTGKWDKAWFRKLSPSEKCVWMFLCDKCDHAGVWEIDMDALEFFVGTLWRLSDLESTFGDKILLVGDSKLVLEGFTEFQYGSLNPDNRVHKSVLIRLEKLAPKKGLKRALLGPKDTDTDKDKDTDKEKEEGEIRNFSGNDLADFWNANCGVLPKVTTVTEKRRTHARAQFSKYPDLFHWTDVLNRWKASEFCVTKWKPTFDDWLNENKRIVTLEGKYDDRDNAGAPSGCDYRTMTQILADRAKRGEAS